MKKTVSILAAVATVAGATVAFAANGDSNIATSKHNMRNGTGFTVGAGTTAQICVYCHTPHNARVALPLWNRNVAAKSRTSFTLYSSQTMQSRSIKTGFTSDSMSLFCMSCHDGSAVGGTMVMNQPRDSGATITAAITRTNMKFDTDANNMLSNTHPINFTLRDNGYTGAATDFSDAGQMRNDGKSDLVWANGNVYMGTNANNYPLFKSERGSYSVECSSCHSVHDDYYAPFLRSTMQGSVLCLGCHRK